MRHDAPLRKEKATVRLKQCLCIPREAKARETLGERGTGEEIIREAVKIARLA